MIDDQKPRECSRAAGKPFGGLTLGMGTISFGALGMLALVALLWFAPRALARFDIGASGYSHLTAAARASTVNDVRGTLLQAVGVLAIGAAGVVGWKQLGINRRQAELNFDQLDATIDANRLQQELGQESLTSQRLTTSVEQLGSASAAVRVGAIYGLEIIASSSPKQTGVVMEIVCAFVRSTSRQPFSPSPETRLPIVSWTASQLIEPTLGAREPDRQAAIRVLGRLTTTPLGVEYLIDRVDRSVFDLERAIMLRGDFTLGRFDGASFRFCDLRGANMSGGSFEFGNFVWASLAGANLAGADLIGAAFIDADLREVDFTGVT